MRRSLHAPLLASTLLLAIACPGAAHASPQMFVEYGCYNCHGNFRRGDAPSIEGLTRRLSRFKDDPTAEQKFIDEYRAGEMFHPIPPHERITPDAARALIHWLAQGAKATP